jgi:hypothetical protein
MKKIIIPVLTVLFACSCGRKIDGGDPETIFLRSYVMTYYDFEGLSLTLSDNEIIMNEYPHAGVDGVVGSRNKWLGSYNNTGAMKEVYDALCEKHNDMNFNRNFAVFDGFGPHHTYCIGVDFVSIDIVSNADFDEDHPAGSSLADLVMFETLSLKPYIDSGYTIENSFIDHFSHIECLMSSVTPDQLTLLGHRYQDFGRLAFENEPTLSKSHRFYVTLTADDGRVFTDSIQMTFE